MSDPKYYFAKSGRKNSNATVRLMRGKGAITVNGKSADDYFGAYLAGRLSQPLKTIESEAGYDISCLVRGGGKSGQADACRLGISKCLAQIGEELRTTLKKQGLLKRDTRAKERKKYGLKRARKAPQFTKR